MLKGACPACGTCTRNLTKHINRGHGPHGPEGTEDRTGVFALAVVRRRSDGRFLMVQERYQVSESRPPRSGTRVRMGGFSQV